MPVGGNLNLKREKIIPDKETEEVKGEATPKVDDKKAQPSKKEKADKKAKRKNITEKKTKAKDKSPQVKAKKKKEEKPQKPASAEKEKKTVESKELSDGKILGSFLEENEPSYKVEIIPSRRKSVKKTNIEISGELKINNIQNIHNEIKEVFNNYDIITFVLKDVKDMDLNMVQLFYMYKCRYEKEGKQVTIMANVPKSTKDLLTVGGFGNLLFPVIK